MRGADVPRVSIPEKTLEHWVSQYVLYRFRSKAKVWWPTLGDDVELNSLPLTSGKSVKLEIKTATPSANGHTVRIDLGQLWEYSRRPLGMQPFYVLPLPPWTGQIELPTNRVWRRHQHQSELAFRRSGTPYFADWMTVLSTSEVADRLRDELRAHGSTKPDGTAMLLEVDRGVASWAHPDTPPPSANWTAFWDQLVGCGAPTWPQRIVVHPDAVRAGRIDYTTAVDALRQSPSQRAQDLETAVCLMPTQGGAYEPIALTDSESPENDESVDAVGMIDEPEIRRVEVFLTASALRLD
jgi:hypothetical protein